MIEVSLDLDHKTLKTIEGWSTTLDKAVLSGMIKAMRPTVKSIKDSFGRPGMLKKRTGKLANNIRNRVFQEGDVTTGEISVKRVVYAAIHEYGGTIRPKKPGGWLCFKIGQQFIKVKKVTMPKRPYLKPGLENNLKNVQNIIMKEIVKDFSL